MTRFIFTLLFIQPLFLTAQFPPAADQIGTTAIHKDSSIFINWAKTAIIERGEQNISDDSLNFAEIGEPDFSLGISDNQTVSLGDNGSIVLTFNPPISDKEGFDFAVFENGFETQGGYFLELAFVEVSSDGQFFVRFPATSLTDTTTQLATFDLVDPTLINNLAGKYVSNFGTPFDLNELNKIPELNISAITHVKIVDVIGSITDSLATYDLHGNKVNDPFPTPFPSGGFDLDAVGVIHQKLPTSVYSNISDNSIEIFPNPLFINNLIHLKLNFPVKNNFEIQLFNSNGILLKNQPITAKQMSISFLEIGAGVFYLKISNHEFSTVKKIVVLE